MSFAVPHPWRDLLNLVIEKLGNLVIASGEVRVVGCVTQELRSDAALQQRSSAAVLQETNFYHRERRRSTEVFHLFIRALCGECLFVTTRRPCTRRCC